MLSGGLLPARMNKGELFYGRASYSGPDERYDGENSPDGGLQHHYRQAHHHRGRHYHPADKDLFGGGSGAGVNIQPVAFLVIKDGCVRTIQLSDNADTINRALTMLPELVEKVSALVSKKGEKPADEAPKAE